MIPYINVNAGDQVTIVVDGVTNDSSTGTQNLDVSTTSDPSTVAVSYELSSSGRIGAPNYSQSSYVPSATDVTVTVSFVSTDGMTGSSPGATDFSAVVLCGTERHGLRRRWIRWM